MTKKHSKKRLTLSADDDRDDTPLARLVNFGPVTLPEFEALGLKTLGDLRKLGWEDVCRKWVEFFPERLNVNAFIGVIATLEGISWTKISPAQRALARSLVNSLREENGLPAVKPAKKRR